MTTEQKVIKNKLDVLRLAQMLGSKAAALELAIEQPARGPIRAANKFAKRGHHVSPSGVRSVWARGDLGTMKLRLRALSAKVAQDGLIFTDAQVAALERAKEAQEAHGEIETEHPGYVGAPDTYYVGTIKGVGRIYQQTFIDTNSKVTFAKVYDRPNTLVAAELLNDRVVPFFGEQDVRLLRILTDRGSEYCGARERHEYQLYLAVEDIDHSRTRARRPQSNGICERFHKTKGGNGCQDSRQLTAQPNCPRDGTNSNTYPARRRTLMGANVPARVVRRTDRSHASRLVRS